MSLLRSLVRLRPAAAAGCVLLAFAGSVRAVPPEPAPAATPAAEQPPAPPTDFQDHATVSSVVIPVTVYDRRGRLVATLDEKAFHLAIDGISFHIGSFWREGGLPLSLAFVLDTSGSMAGRRLARARQVIDEFVHQLRPHDEACLITFGAGQVTRRLRFGEDPGRIPGILESVKGYGTTALYDVVSAAPEIMDGAHNVRRAILLFTDGVDTASRMTPAQAVQVLQALNDPLYVFGIEPPPVMEAGQESYESLLERFAAATGGKYLRVGNVADLPAVGARLRRELTMRYILTVTPSGVGAVKWRPIAVTVDGPYHVVTRRGYTGTLP